MNFRLALYHVIYTVVASPKTSASAILDGVVCHVRTRYVTDVPHMESVTKIPIAYVIKVLPDPSVRKKYVLRIAPRTEFVERVRVYVFLVSLVLHVP